MQSNTLRIVSNYVALCDLKREHARRGTQWPAGLPVTPDLPGFVPIVHLLRLCPAFVSMLVVVFLIISPRGFAHASIVDLSRLCLVFASII